MDTTTVLVGVLSLIGGMVAALGAWAGKRGETRGAVEAAFRDDLLQRLADVEDRLKTVEQDLQESQAEVLAAERRAHELQLALARGLYSLRQVAHWLDSGMQPPAPDVLPVIDEITGAVNRAGTAVNPHPREPPG